MSSTGGSTREDAGQAPAAGGERRHLAILFSDLCASVQLSDSMDAEDFAQMLETVRGVMREIIASHGGTVARIQGDGLLAVFGFPETGEDDARRAAAAALSIHRAVRDLHLGEAVPRALRPLSMHSGLHSGLTFVSQGDIERGRFEVLGEIPNVAARLCALAQPDQLLATEESLGPDAHAFQITPAVWTAIKGRAVPLRVMSVLRAHEATRRYEAGQSRGPTPFVGRDRAMEALQAALAVAAAGTNKSISLVGEAGAGKTRLLEEACRSAAWRAIPVLRGYCESHLGAEPLQPWMQVLRSLNDDVRSLMRKASELVPAIANRIDHLASTGPLVVVLDDWQWADDASRQVLDAVRALPRPILVVLASRPDADEFGADDADKLLLGPLVLADTAQCVRARVPSADPFLIEEIHAYAGGIPLYVEELCHAARARQEVKAPEKSLTGTAWLNAMVEARLAQLTDEQAQAVRVVSVIGAAFPAWLAEAVLNRSPQHPVWQQLADCDLLWPADGSGAVRFKHGLTRDAVYATVGMHSRRAIHHDVAAALANRAGTDDAQRNELLEALAYHHEAAGDHDAGSRFAELAGDKALAANALDRARLQYQAALGALDQLRALSDTQRLRWCTVANKLGMVCVFDPLALRDGVAVFERAAHLARTTAEDAVIARADYWLGYIHYAKGWPRAAEAHCRASLARAQVAGDQRLVAQVRATLGQVLVSSCQYEQALPLIDGAIDDKRQQARPGSGVAIGSAYALSCKGCVLADQGRFADADACFDEALKLLGGSLHAVGSSVRGWIAAARIWQGRWDEAVDMADAGARIAEGARTRQLLAMSRALGGYARWMRDGDDQGLHALREATAWIEQREGAFFTSLNHGWVIDALTARGEFDMARVHAAQLLRRARAHDRLGESMGCRAMGRHALAAGDTTRAARWLGRAQASAAARGAQHEVAHNLLLAAELDNARGRRDSAQALRSQALACYEQMSMPWHAARMHAVTA